MTYRRSNFALAALGVFFCAEAALAQPRPLLYSMGRFRASWAGRPPSYDVAIWDKMVAIGVTANGADLVWVDAEPVQGQLNWDAINRADTEVNEILARGMAPHMFLGLTPAWAALHPNLPPYRTPPAEEFVDEFMAFHTWVAQRYKGKVKHYYFWNEPNGCSWINDGCSNMNGYPLYTKWLIRCSQAVKAGDPDAKIIAGRLDYNAGVTQGWTYVEGMYNEGAGPHIDGIAIHPYDWGGTIHWQALTDTRNVMVAHGDANKPIWLSEYGWNHADHNITATKLTSVLTQLKQPQWSFVEMANYLVMNDGAGVENYGLTDADLNPRPSYNAFAAIDKTWPQFVNFTADVTRGPPPLAVQFTDTSSLPGASAWLWEFGDGQTSTQRHPSHTYQNEGAYNVKLTVTGNGGPLSHEKPGMIRVGAFQGVAFIGSQLPPTTSDAQVIQRLESLGLAVDVYDDEPANRPSAAEIASTHALVVISSTIISANIGGDFRSQPVPLIFWEGALSRPEREPLSVSSLVIDSVTTLQIVDNTHPITAGFSLAPVAVYSSPARMSVGVADHGPGVKLLATRVNVPTDKAIMAAETGSVLLGGHIAPARRVFLFLEDATWPLTTAAARQLFDQAVIWALGPVTAGFIAAPTNGLVPLPVQFTDQSSGPVVAWTWDFGDGQTSTQRNPVHTYTSAGTYDVELTVRSPSGQENVMNRLAYVSAATGIPGDLDGDEDVDQDDFGEFQACVTGPAIGPPAPGCEDADHDDDGDVDLADFGVLQRCMTGADIPGSPDCQ